MQLAIEWTHEFRLRKGTLELDEVPKEPGVYVFGRRHGKKFEALYVGQSTRVYDRVKSHLNNLKIMNHINEAKAGHKVLLIGLFRSKSGQKVTPSLQIIERALIRHFLANNDDLVNKSGTRIREHVITFSNSKIIPDLPADMAVPKK